MRRRTGETRVVMGGAAAIILCAGKGTRMGDDSKNKVCFDCAGLPVIRRIVANMRAGGVAEYGVSEIARSAHFMDALAAGDYVRLGRMMKTSHDGDRVVWPDGMPPQASVADDKPDAWHGAYACSTPRIDGLCDLLDSAPGVYGAQMVGAGLGGCVVALVEKAKAEAVLALLEREYYARYGLAPSAFVCVPSTGSGVRY